MTQRLLLLFLSVAFAATTTEVRAHDVNHATLQIEKTADGWQAYLTFSTYGLERMLQQYTSDESLQLTGSEDDKQLVREYLLSRLAITVNKQVQATLTPFFTEVNDHFTEVRFHLKELPEWAAYWQYDLGYVQENPSMRTIIWFKTSEDESRFSVTGGRAEMTLSKDGEIIPLETESKD